MPEESNEGYNLVNKSTRDIIWEWDMLTNELTCSSVFSTLFGYAEVDTKNNVDWWVEKIHPADKERVLKQIKTCIDNRQENWQDEYRIRAADGSYKHVIDRGFIRFNGKGIPYRMIGAMTDLTEKKKPGSELAAQEMKFQKRLLEVSIQAHEEEKSELGRELHDNINQLLAIVRMYLGMVVSGQQTEVDLVGKSYEYVKNAMSAIRNLSHSLITPSLADIGLKEAFEELTSDTNSLHVLQVRLKIDENYDEKGLGKNKKLMFYRILQEQLNNISKHARASRVDIGFKKVGDHLFLSIADNGIGFDSSKMTQGLGLRNISNRVEFYSGNMKIISAPGKGCTLEIFIPC